MSINLNDYYKKVEVDELFNDVNESINELRNIKSALKTSIENKGVVVNDDALLESYPGLIDNISISEGPSDNPGEEIENDFIVDLYSGSYLYKSIKKLPIFDISSTTKTSYMFYGWTALETIPILDMKNVTQMDYMFYNCTSLTTIPELDLSNVQNMLYAFGNCTGLTTIPALNTASLTNMNYMFDKCSSLYEIGEIDASSVNSFDYLFRNCSNLENFGGLKNLGKCFEGIGMSENTLKLDLSYCTKLTHESLMNVLNKLYDIESLGVNRQKILLGSTNYEKLTEDEIAIAINKGWNVVS